MIINKFNGLLLIILTFTAFILGNAVGYSIADSSTEQLAFKQGYMEGYAQGNDEGRLDVLNTKLGRCK